MKRKLFVITCILCVSFFILRPESEGAEEKATKTKLETVGSLKSKNQASFPFFSPAPLLSPEQGIQVEETLEETISQASIAPVKKPKISPDDSVEDEVALLTTQASSREAVGYQKPSNSKPTIDPHVFSQISAEVATWRLEQDITMYHRVSFQNLFIDAEDDFLSYQVGIEGAKTQSISVQLLSSQIVVSGTPHDHLERLTLVIRARDNHHGSNEESWVVARFPMPNIEEKPDKAEMLVDQPLYRLTTTRIRDENGVAYDILQCEVFLLRDDEVWYAISQDRLKCPDISNIAQRGTYRVEGDTVLIQFSREAFEITWLLRFDYDAYYGPSAHHYLVTQRRGGQYQTDTLFDNKRAAEARLNMHTGHHIYEGRYFDHLLMDPEGNYYLVGMMNYMYNVRIDDPSYYQPADSDLNIAHPVHSMTCADIERWYGYSVLIGPSQYNTLISTSGDPMGNYPPQCGTYQQTPTRVALYLDLSFDPSDIPIHGRVYSYLFHPKPEYKDRLETFKINLLYAEPQE